MRGRKNALNLEFGPFAVALRIAGQAFVKRLDSVAAGSLAQGGHERMDERAERAEQHRPAEPGRDAEMLAIAFVDAGGMIEKDTTEHRPRLSRPRAPRNRLRRVPALLCSARSKEPSLLGTQGLILPEHRFFRLREMMQMRIVSKMALAIALGGMANGAKAQSAAPPDWAFSVTPYGWFAGLSGNVQTPLKRASDRSFSADFCTRWVASVLGNWSQISMKRGSM